MSDTTYRLALHDSLLEKCVKHYAPTQAKHWGGLGGGGPLVNIWRSIWHQVCDHYRHAFNRSSAPPYSPTGRRRGAGNTQRAMHLPRISSSDNKARLPGVCGTVGVVGLQLDAARLVKRTLCHRRLSSQAQVVPLYVTTLVSRWTPRISSSNFQAFCHRWTS